MLNNVYLTLKDSFSTEREPIPLLEESALLWQEIMSIDGGEATRKEAFKNAKGSPMTAYLKEKDEWKRRYPPLSLLGNDWCFNIQANGEAD